MAILSSFDQPDYESWFVSHCFDSDPTMRPSSYLHPVEPVDVSITIGGMVLELSA